MKSSLFSAALRLSALLLLAATANAGDWVVYQGKEGPGKGKHIVLMGGDEEYRSEEGLPMLGKILAERHGFKCTVLFPLAPDGTIDPNNQTNVVGLENLDTADMVVMLMRFREFPDDKMKHFADFLNAGKPILALRTSTHAFAYSRNKTSPYAKYDWQSKVWQGGFGGAIIGDTWISHHGNHGSESTRGLINGRFENHPILRGVKDIWGPTDVYGIVNLPSDANVLVYGLTLSGMKPDDFPNYKKSVMPLIWTRTVKNEAGATNRIIGSTIGASVDLQSEDLRRLCVNAVYWGTGLEAQIPKKNNVDCVGEYKPTFFGFGKFTKGIKPSDHELK